MGRTEPKPGLGSQRALFYVSTTLTVQAHVCFLHTDRNSNVMLPQLPDKSSASGSILKIFLEFL